jgi:hypothetical protein
VACDEAGSDAEADSGVEGCRVLVAAGAGEGGIGELLGSRVLEEEEEEEEDGVAVLLEEGVTIELSTLGLLSLLPVLRLLSLLLVLLLLPLLLLVLLGSALLEAGSTNACLQTCFPSAKHSSTSFLPLWATSCVIK